MKSNKRGVSEIVSTILIILIVFVAIGLVWGIISRVLKTPALECKSDCLGIQLSFVENNLNCNVSDENVNGPIFGKVTRGSDNLESLKMLIVIGGNSSHVTEAPGILGTKDFKKLNDTDAGITSGAKVFVKLAPVINCKGKDTNCDALESIEITCTE